MKVVEIVYLVFSGTVLDWILDGEGEVEVKGKSVISA